MQQLVIKLVEAQLAIVVVQSKIELGSINGNAAETQIVAIGEEQIDQFDVKVAAVGLHLAPLDLAPGLVTFPQRADARFDFVAQFLG